MKLVEKLGLGSGVYTVGGKLASGKTTLLSIIASEYYLAGLSVLFLTDEDTNKSVLNKIRKTIGVSNISFENRLKVKKFVSFKGHEEDKYDVIIADVYKTSNEFDLLVEIAKQNECVLITSARPYILINENYDIGYDAIDKRIIEKSDKIITITRLRDNEKNPCVLAWRLEPTVTARVMQNGSDLVPIY